MEINEIYSGFKLTRIKELKDIDGIIYEFKHLKSEASLVYLKTDDTNKCFSIGFKTPPEDSTGICHIIEHSLLCGSKKYPVKEPFVNLIKGSMASFLNAMTASDCTVYPIASQNDKDFDNLMSVYLDAVFAPLSIKDPKPFLQEGWHYELLNEEDELSYKGIVYNEMQGAMSNPLSQLSEYSNQVLYKGTCYEYNSGGDPDVIPELTFEYYKNYYHKHYHPSNGVIYLYGDMNILEKLEYIDKEYLQYFEPTNEKITISLPKPEVNKDVYKEYAINSEESEKDNTYISISYGLTHAENIKDILGMSLLNEALLGTNASPLKKVLIESELAEDIESYVDDGSIYSSFGVVFHKTNKESKEKLVEIFNEELRRLAKEGIDKELLLSTININEFKHKELDTGRMPKGLAFAFSIMQGFMYDIPYEDYIDTCKYYKFYKENLDKRYFEELIEKYLLNSNHYAIVTMTPNKDLEKQKALELQQKLSNIKSQMSSEEIKAVIDTTNELLAYQSKRDDIEDVKKLPELKLSDIPTKINITPTEEVEDDKYHFVYHKVNTNKIAYLRAYFDLNVLEFDELPYARILARLLVKLDTENYTAEKLQSFIKTYLGGISFSLITASRSKEECMTKMLVTACSLDENIKYIPTILNEVINNTIYDENKIKTILIQQKNRERSAIIDNGTQVATTVLRSGLSKEGVIVNKVSGLEMYKFLADIVENFSLEHIEKIKKVAMKIFNENNVIYSLGGDQDTLNELTNAVKQLDLNKEINKPVLSVSYQKESNEALIIPSGVNCNVKGLNLKDLGEELNGSLYVLQHIVNYDWLWPEVRVKGGAYGCNLSLSFSDDITFGSFSDPNVENTYNVYDETANYLKNFDTTKEEFTSYLIGTVAKIDPPSSVYSKIINADKNYLCKISEERLVKLKEEILSTTIEKIKSYSSLFKKIAQLSRFYSVGNEEKINEFTKITKAEKLI